MRFISVDSLRILKGSDVVCGHDFLRECRVEMRTPVGHHAVAALLKRNVPPPAIADDGMERDLNRDRVHRQQKRRVRFETADTVWDKRALDPGGRGGGP